MKKILLDTHILIFDALAPEKLSQTARHLLDQAEALFCADISLWELSMLIQKKRIPIQENEAERFIEDILAARNIKVLPISPAIATASQRWETLHKDPADLLIAATAFCHDLILMTKDSTLQSITEIKTIW